MGDKVISEMQVVWMARYGFDSRRKNSMRAGCPNMQTRRHIEYDNNSERRVDHSAYVNIHRRSVGDAGEK